MIWVDRLAEKSKLVVVTLRGKQCGNDPSFYNFGRNTYTMVELIN